MKVTAVGMAWYRREDYEKLKSIFVDGNGLPKTYDDWLQKAEKGFQHFTSQGHTIEKVYIDPNTFPDWCRSRGLEINSKARTEFASEFVAKKQLGKI